MRSETGTVLKKDVVTRLVPRTSSAPSMPSAPSLSSPGKPFRSHLRWAARATPSDHGGTGRDREDRHR